MHLLSDAGNQQVRLVRPLFKGCRVSLPLEKALLKRLDWVAEGSFYTGWRHQKPAVMGQERKDRPPEPSELGGWAM